MLVPKLLHGIGLLIGFGGALVSAGLMLRVGKEDEKRRRTGRMVRRICILTWTGLLLLTGSGIALTVQHQGATGPLLHVKHIFVAIILADAFIIHFYLFPRYFRAIESEDFPKVYGTMRRVGALSVFCWISVLALSFFLGA